MVSAIGQTFDGFAAAEGEVRRTWITDRPMTFAFGQFKNRAALSDRDSVFDDLLWLRRRKRFCPEESVHRLFSSGLDAPIVFGLGGWSFAARRQTEPMHLCDHRVAGNA